jgi:sec-independent protein translocase protein TatA
VPVLGFWDIVIIALVLLLIFGPKRLPQMGRSIGGGIREFKDSITGHVDKQDAEAESEAAPRQLPPAPPAEPAPPTPGSDPREHDTLV